MLANRDAALLQYQKAAAALDASTKERQRWQEAEHSGAPSPRSGVLGKLDELMYDPQKGSKAPAAAPLPPRRAGSTPRPPPQVEVRVKEADAELSAAKERWEARASIAASTRPRRPSPTPPAPQRPHTTDSAATPWPVAAWSRPATGLLTPPLLAPAGDLDLDPHRG